MSTYLTADQIASLENCIYHSLMDNPELGMGEMGEARDEAERIVREWMEGNDIEEQELQSTPEKTDRELALEWWDLLPLKMRDSLSLAWDGKVYMETTDKIEAIWNKRGKPDTQERKDIDAGLIPPYPLEISWNTFDGGENHGIYAPGDIDQKGFQIAVISGLPTSSRETTEELGKAYARLFASAPTLKKENEELKVQNTVLKGVVNKLMGTIEDTLNAAKEWAKEGVK